MAEEELLDWLEMDEARSRPYRAERLGCLLDILKLPERGMLHWGGAKSLLALTELRLAYIHGLYFSTVLLALSFIEHEVSGSLHAAGSNSAAKSSLEELAREGFARGMVSEDEISAISRLRSIRNAYVHYRPISHSMHQIQRALATDTPPEELPEADALYALTVVASFINRRNRSRSE